MIKAVLLALLAAAEPLQAGLIFACNVMEQRFHGSCCCEHEELAQAGVAVPDCASGLRDAVELTDRSCCDTELELTVSQEAEDSVLGPAQPTRDADPDPPQLIAVLPADLPTVLAPGIAARFAAGSLSPASPGTATYLLTQRLRI